MRIFTLIFALNIALVAPALYAAPMDDSSPAIAGGGGNLTSFSGGGGAVNNNQYNQLMNPARAPTNAAVVADFGNCNALIQRCATPKCSGCNDMSLAVPIVAGCVEASNECKRHGDALTNAIAAQIVSANIAKANASQEAAATANAQQAQAMQSQMQQMQQQLAAQQAESAAQMQAALAAQQQATESALAEQAAMMKSQQTTSQTLNISAGSDVSSETLARQQIVGQVMSSLDGVDAQISSLKQTVKNVLDYADCDYNATQCNGPRRVSTFRKKAQAFFQPYDGVLDSLEDSLYTAMAAGVDVTDIYMMLTNSCTQWGKYLCNTPGATPVKYCSTPGYDRNKFESNCTVSKVAGQNDYQVLNPDCQFVQLFRNNDRDEIQQNYILTSSGAAEDKSHVRLACMSDSLIGGGLLTRRNRQRSAGFDIDQLEIIINQDEPRNIDRTLTGAAAAEAKTKNCRVRNLNDLRTQVANKRYSNVVVDVTFNNLDSLCDLSDLSGRGCAANPMYAMCSTHAYNIGLTSNNISAEEKRDMKDAIALKATVIAQQLKKQADYIESIARQMKIQMQKSVMSAATQTAGGNTEGAGATASLDGTSNCAAKNPQEAIACLRQNHTIISEALAARKIPDAAIRGQLRTDGNMIASLLGVYSTTARPTTAMVNDINTSCKNATSSSVAQTCLTHMNSALWLLDNEQQKLSTPSR